MLLVTVYDVPDWRSSGVGGEASWVLCTHRPFRRAAGLVRFAAMCDEPVGAGASLHHIVSAAADRRRVRTLASVRSWPGDRLPESCDSDDERVATVSGGVVGDRCGGVVVLLAATTAGVAGGRRRRDHTRCGLQVGLEGDVVVVSRAVARPRPFSFPDERGGVKGGRWWPGVLRLRGFRGRCCRRRVDLQSVRRAGESKSRWTRRLRGGPRQRDRLDEQSRSLGV